jgi:hypothetical protein
MNLKFRYKILERINHGNWALEYLTAQLPHIDRIQNLVQSNPGFFGGEVNNWGQNCLKLAADTLEQLINEVNAADTKPGDDPRPINDIPEDWKAIYPKDWEYKE